MMANSIAKDRAFKIKNHTLASRCEVCHQSDLYDADNNICQRCCSYRVVKATQDALTKLSPEQNPASQRQSPESVLAPPPAEPVEFNNEILIYLAVSIAGAVTSCVSLQFIGTDLINIWALSTVFFSAICYWILARHRFRYAMLFHLVYLLVTFTCLSRFEIFFRAEIALLAICWFFCFFFSIMVYFVCFIIDRTVKALTSHSAPKRKTLLIDYILIRPRHY